MYIHDIDIAHPPLTSGVAEEILNNELNHIRSTQKWRVIKIIHGKGTDEHPSILKQVVRNWAYRNRSHIRAIIPGEKYDIDDPATQEMRRICGQIPDPELGRMNAGITLIWIK